MKPVIFLMGPTATGKTDVAVDLYQRLPVELISVDSALVYKGMDIGTAKPSRKLLESAPHRLIDICDPVNTYSAASFRSDALSAIEEIESRDRIPLLVGGTGLYFRALEQGFSELPDANPAIRARLDEAVRQDGLQSLYQKLVAIDPQAAERIDANDSQRIQRALEVYELTGMNISEHFRLGREQGLQREIIKVLLTPEDRSLHRQQVKQRFQNMLNAGLVDEVRHFFQRDDLTAATPAMRMVGYRQIWSYLEGKIDYQDMEKHAIVATRQLAKRQMTWWRKEGNSHIVNSQSSDTLDQVLGLLKHHSALRNIL